MEFGILFYTNEFPVKNLTNRYISGKARANVRTKSSAGMIIYIFLNPFAPRMRSVYMSSLNACKYKKPGVYPKKISWVQTPFNKSLCGAPKGVGKRVRQVFNYIILLFDFFTRY